jgi:hypothetical protein
VKCQQVFSKVTPLFKTFRAAEIVENSDDFIVGMEGSLCCKMQRKKGFSPILRAVKECFGR